MPTTEIVTAALKPGSEIGDPSNAAAVVLKSVGDTLAQQDGHQSTHFGMQLESPNKIQLMINWDSLPAHKAFMASDPYKPFFSTFSTALDTPASLSMVHVDFQPSDAALSQALAAPITEIATFFFDGQGPSSYVEGALKFRDVMEKEHGHGYVGAAVGVSHEEDVESEGGKKGRAAVVVIGWESVEAHLKFRQHEVFQRNIHFLREGSVGAEMHHVKFLEFLEE